MYALIRQGSGKYYGSTVFGFYKEGSDPYDFDEYYIVLNEEKNRLIRQFEFEPRKRFLNKLVLLTDDDQEGWHVDKNGYGEAAFLSKEQVLELTLEETQPEELLKKCLEIDQNYHYEECQEIRSEKDIERLMLTAGGFHDGVIIKLEKRTDDLLYILFDGIWGCQIELFFRGNISFCIGNKDPEEDDPYWFSASLIRDAEGYFYLVDEEGVEPGEDLEGFCWFKGKALQYRVIPN